MATNRVLEQHFRGREVKPGDLVVSGSAIDLTLGLSSEDNSTVVPRLIGMKYIRAVDALHEHSLNVGRIRFDSDIRTYADSTNAVVYKQDAVGAYKMLGTAINLYLTLDPSKVPAQ
jgi:beta-lactam-binding protein with PASTA domain